MASVFNESIRGVRALIDAVQLLKKELRELATNSKKVTKEMKFETSADFKNLDKEIKQVTSAQKSLISVEKEEVILKKELANLNKAEQQALQASFKTKQQVSREEERQIKIIKKLKREREKIGSVYAKESAQLNKLRKRQKDLILTEKKATTETRALAREIKRLDGRLKRADASVGQFQRNVGNYKSALAGSLGTVGQFATGAGAIAAGVLIAGRAISSAVNIIKGFQQANANLQAVLGKTKEEMIPLIELAKELGATTSFSASQVVELETELAKLGFPIDDITQMAASTLDAANAMGSDLAAQAKLTGATLRTFNLDASETQRVNDVLAKATSASALDFEKLASSMSTIAPVANAFGFSLEGTTALLGQLSNAGFDASSAATATRNILLNLADSSSKLGKSLKEPVKDLPSLVRGLKQLKNEGVDLGKALELTDKRSVAAFSTFLEGTDKVLALNEALKNAKGTAAEMAAIQLDTLDGSLKILNSSWEGFILSVEDGGGALSKVARGAIDELSSALSVLSGTFDESKSEAGFLVIQFQKIKIVFDLVKGVIQIIVALFKRFSEEIGKVAKKFGILQGSSERFRIIMNLIRKIFFKLPEIINLFVDSVISGFDDMAKVVGGVMLIFEGWFDLIKTGFTASINTIFQFTNVFAAAIEAIRTGSIKKFTDGFKKSLTSIADGFAELGNNPKIIEGGKKIAEGLREGFDRNIALKDSILVLLAGTEDLSQIESGEDFGKKLADNVASGFKKGLKSNAQSAADALALFMQKQAIVISKEETNERINSFKESEKASIKIQQRRLELALRGIEVLREVELKDIELRERIALKATKEGSDARLLVLAKFAEERRLLIMKTNDDIQDLQDIANDRLIESEEEKQARLEELESEQKIRLQNRAKFIEEALDKAAAKQRKLHQERLSQFDEVIAASKKEQDSLREDARKGIADAEENIVFARKKQREAELERQREVARQERIEKGLAFIKLLASNAGNPNVKNPVPTTIAQFTAAELFFQAIKGFYGGTENVGESMSPTLNTGRDDYVVRVDKDERIVDPSNNNKMSGITNDELGMMAERYKTGQLVDINRQHQALHVTNMYQDNGKMEKKLDEVVHAIDNIVIPETTWDDKEQAWIRTWTKKGKIKRIHESKRGGVWA